MTPKKKGISKICGHFGDPITNMDHRIVSLSSYVVYYTIRTSKYTRVTIMGDMNKQSGDITSSQF